MSVTLWLVALVLATMLIARPEFGTASRVFSAAVYAVGALICHQRPERSFHLWGMQWPVCARCVGLYAGAALSAWWASRPARHAGEALHPSRARLIVFMGALPSLLTLCVEWSTGSTPANLTRALAGVPLGAAIMWVLAVTLDTATAAVEVN
jgi:hypothetical protein